LEKGRAEVISGGIIPSFSKEGQNFDIVPKEGQNFEIVLVGT
jgi:hypothetical protein